MMNKELKWKFFLVGILVAVFLLSIYKNGLKPGIDLAGGSSLLYEIDTTDMPESERRGICEDMIRVLRQRIDPSDQMGLVWRPHGVDKIEIQLPLATEETRELRGKFNDVLSKLEDGNVNMLRVKEALVHPEGKSTEEYQQARTELFANLAGENPQRQQTLEELAAIHDQLEAARKTQNDTLVRVEELSKQADEAGVTANRMDSLRRRWNDLSEEERETELNKLASDDPTLAEVIKKLYFSSC